MTNDMIKSDLNKGRRYLADAASQSGAVAPGGKPRVWVDPDTIKGIAETMERAADALTPADDPTALSPETRAAIAGLKEDHPLWVMMQIAARQSARHHKFKLVTEDDT